MFRLELNKFWTKFELLILDKVNNSNLKNEINELFTNYEFIFSRFIDDSEISKVNKNKWGDLSPLFFLLFKKVIELSELTWYFFNPFVNVESIGYSTKKISNNNDIENIWFYDNFELKSNNIILKNNSLLDFWWLWKWYFVDYISDYLIKNNFKNYFINFWWDIYVSWKKDLDKSWRIWIENPFLLWDVIWYIDIENKSISSSWNYFRNWNINGINYHHIINPHTNKNEFEIKMISIVSDKTFFSDWIATSVFNMWISKWLLFLNNNNIDGLIIWENAKAYFTKWFIKKYNFDKIY
jgi:thiamine biosynthesis lipoprotein